MKMKSILKEAGFVDQEDDEYEVGQKVQAYIQCALTTENIRGGATDNKRAASESIVTLLLETPENVVATPLQEVRAIKGHV